MKTLLGVIACSFLYPSLSAQALPSGVLADSSLSWRTDGVQPDGEWQYGYYQSGYDASTFTKAASWIGYYPGPDSWVGGHGNVWDAPVYPRIGKYALAQSQSRKAVRRWTSSYSGNVIVHLDCQPLRTSPAAQVFRLYKNGVLEQTFEKDVDTGTHHIVFSESCDVAVGDQLDFVADTGQWVHASVRILSDIPIPDALIYYPFDELNDYPSGWPADGPLYDRRSRVGDFSGNDNHATLVNIPGNRASQAGIHDQARYFDGGNDYIITEKLDIGDGLSALTLSAWISPEGDMIHNAGLFTSCGTEDYIGLIAHAVTGKVEFRTIIGGENRVVRAPELVPSGEWTHVIGVWESGKSHKLYLNGVMVASLSNPTVGAANIRHWYLGANPGFEEVPANPVGFRGLIDEAALISRALVDFEITNLYREHASFPSVTGGGAEYFDGRDDVSVISSLPAGTTELTLAAWINPFSKDDYDGIATTFKTDRFSLLLSGRGKGNPVEFWAGGTRLTGPDYSCPTGQWNHVVGVWKAGEIQKLYLNGVEVAENTSPGSIPLDAEHFFVGRDWDYSTFSQRFYHGLLDGLTLLPQALTASEVQSLYQQNLPAAHTGPVEMPGYLRWDYGFGFTHLTVEDLVADPAFHLNGTKGYHTGFLNRSATDRVRNAESATRLRGYIEAPETGEYFFWASGRAAIDLSLSPDEQKYTKQRIARLSPIDGTAAGVAVDWPNLWDNFFAQISEPIQLVAGQRYYLDVLQTSGGGGQTDAHAAIAWARPNGTRELIPMEFLYPYVQEDHDRDDDFLPDAWETQYGLDPANNGSTETTLQGEYGDFDSDGLTNREEYLLGTDPSNSDTDGDGLSDLAEQTIHGTDPTTSDVTPETVVATIDPQSVTGFGTSWIETGSGGVLAANFRGTATFDFTVPSDGHWILQLEGQLRGDLRFDETLPVQISIDGGEIERPIITFRNNLPGALRTTTPWLTAGSHSLSLFIDNYTTRRTLEITSLKVITPGGLDANGNGHSDIVEQYLTERSFIHPHTVIQTPISPLFLEGRARSLGHFELRTQPDGPGSTIRHKDSFWATKIPQLQSQINSTLTTLTANPAADRSSAGAAHPALNGPGHGGWFAELPLNANQATSYTAFFENGSLGASGVVVWRPINLFSTSAITIPAGRQLLMGAWDSETDNSDLTFTIDGQVQPIFKAKDALAWSFPLAGQQTVTVLHHQSNQTFTLNVTIRDATLPTDLTIGEQRFRQTDLPGVDSDLTFDTGGEVTVSDLQTLTPTGSTTTLGGNFPGVYRTAARLNASHPDGQNAILDQKVAHVVGVSDALRNGSDTISPQGDGIFLVRSPLLVTHLPANATIEVVVFAGGVTFQDGTTAKTLTVADLDEHGVITLEFLMPAERLGAPCHYITIYDQHGTKVWNSTN